MKNLDIYYLDKAGMCDCEMVCDSYYHNKEQFYLKEDVDKELEKLYNKIRKLEVEIDCMENGGV